MARERRGELQDFARARELGRQPASTTEFGLGLVLASLVSFFAIFLAGALYLRTHAERWPPPSAARAWTWLAGGTPLLLGASLALQRAVRARTRGEARALRRSLALGLACGTAFLGAQLALWTYALPRATGLRDRSFVAVYYTLTGVHALHVLGGIALGAWVWIAHRARSLDVPGRTPVEWCAWYWHFLALVWLPVVALLAWPR